MRLKNGSMVQWPNHLDFFWENENENERLFSFVLNFQWLAAEGDNLRRKAGLEHTRTFGAGTRIYLDFEMRKINDVLLGIGLVDHDAADKAGLGGDIAGVGAGLAQLPPR